MIPQVSFGKHFGLPVPKLITDYPDYVDWLQDLHKKGKASNHVKYLCKQIDEINEAGGMMHVTVHGIKSGTETGSLPKVKKSEDAEYDDFWSGVSAKPVITQRASTFGRFLDVMGVPPNSDASDVPNKLMHIDMESLVVYDISSDPKVELSFYNVKCKIFDHATGDLLQVL